MRLKKYQDKDVIIKRRTLIIFSLLFVLVIGLFGYQSYGRYQDKATFRIINGKLKMTGGSGDIEFAFYNGDQKLDTMPIQNNEEGIVFIKAECTNDAILKWDDNNWDNIVINNLKKTKTSCSLYFGSKTEKICASAGEKSGACYLAKKSDNDTTNFTYDDTNDTNLRYIGATPNNYVYFNCEEGIEPSIETCETWRIIGVMNNIEDENGVIGSYIKIISDKSEQFEKGYSWDSSHSSINNGYGVNEWSEADIEKVLNDEYLYRRKGTNKCYSGNNNSTSTCPDWTNAGIRDESRNMIASVKWNTGTMPVAYDDNLITTKYMYEVERGSHNGKELCLENGGGTNCNDKVTRTTTWIGKVGLMYPSDYGYAVGGDIRATCLDKSLYYYSRDNCCENDWLFYILRTQWTITPGSHPSYAYYVFYIDSSGGVNASTAYNADVVRPTLYLKSDVKIIDRDYEDYGSSTHPFELDYNI